MPFLPVDTAAARAAKDRFNNKNYQPKQNPLTPGQMATGQMDGLQEKKPDNAQQNVPGFATGPAASQAAAQKAQAPVTGAGSIAASGPSTTFLGGQQGGGAGYAGQAQTQSAADRAAQQGDQTMNKQGENAIQQGSADTDKQALLDFYTKNGSANIGRQAEASEYGNRLQSNIGQNGVGQSYDAYDALVKEGQMGRAEEARQKAEYEKQYGDMTEAEKALWDQYMKDGGMSEAERKAKESALAAERDAVRERLNRAQGASGGESALQVIGGGAADYNYQQGMGAIEKEAYDRKMQQAAAAQQIAESEAARQERKANAFDKAQEYFGSKGYTVTAGGDLIGPDGKPVDPNSLTGKDRETYERFMYEMAAETPTSQKDKAKEQAQQDATKKSYDDAKSNVDKAKKNVDVAAKRLEEASKKKAEAEKRRRTGDITVQEYESINNEYAAAQKDLADAGGALTDANDKLKQAEKDLNDSGQETPSFGDKQPGKGA